jgi:uncharacterized protein (DUF2062 family)
MSSRARDRARRAWRRLRGGELVPWRAAASVAIGLAIGVTPLWGLHWLLVLAVCVPLRLDAGVAFLASNVSLPFVAPFITFAELEVGSRLVHGAWLAMKPDDVRGLALGPMLAEIAAGTAVVAIGAALAGGALAYALAAAWRRRARAAGPQSSA